MIIINNFPLFSGGFFYGEREAAPFSLPRPEQKREIYLPHRYFPLSRAEANLWFLRLFST